MIIENVDHGLQFLRLDLLGELVLQHTVRKIPDLRGIGIGLNKIDCACTEHGFTPAENDAVIFCESEVNGWRQYFSFTMGTFDPAATYRGMAAEIAAYQFHRAGLVRHIGL